MASQLISSISDFFDFFSLSILKCQFFQVSNKKFIQCNALSFALAATSLYERENRALAYVILHRFLNRLSDLSLENFNERPFYLYVLRVFRNSIEKSNQRIPHGLYVVNFFFLILRNGRGFQKSAVARIYSLHIF